VASQNKYNVVISSRASQMMIRHAAFLAQVSPEAAERLTDAFWKSAHSLDQMPQRCPWLTKAYFPRNLYRFLMFEKHYMILFQIRDQTVYVDGVLDCRRDYRDLLL